MNIKKLSFKLPKISRRTKATADDSVRPAKIKVNRNGSEKVLMILCYMGILALVPIFWAHKSDLLKSHTRSGVVILLLWVILLYVFQIPLVGVLLGILLLIGCIISCIWGIYDASTGREAKIPVVEKLAGLF